MIPGQLIPQESGFDEELNEALNRRWKPDQLQQLLERNDLVMLIKNSCPECGGKEIYNGGDEVVCKKCGYVIEEKTVLNPSLGFDTTYALTSDVVAGKSLGGTLPPMKLESLITQVNLTDVGLDDADMEIIRRLLASTGEKITTAQAQDAVKSYLKKIRITHLKTQIGHLENPPTTKLKGELTGLLSQFGFYKGVGEYNRFDHQLGNAAGVLAQRIGRFLYASATQPVHDYKRLAAAILLWLIEESHPDIAKEIRAKVTSCEEEMMMVKCISHCPLMEQSRRDSRHSLLG